MESTGTRRRAFVAGLALQLLLVGAAVLSVTVWVDAGFARWIAVAIVLGAVVPALAVTAHRRRRWRGIVPLWVLGAVLAGVSAEETWQAVLIRRGEAVAATVTRVVDADPPRYRLRYDGVDVAGELAGWPGGGRASVGDRVVVVMDRGGLVDPRLTADLEPATGGFEITVLVSLGWLIAGWVLAGEQPPPPVPRSRMLAQAYRPAEPSGGADAVPGLRDAIAVWSAEPAEWADVVRAAWEVQGDGAGGAAVDELAAQPLDRPSAGRGFADLVRAAALEIGVPCPEPGSPDARAAALTAYARRVVAGSMVPRALTGWAVRAGAGLRAATPFVALDEAYRDIGRYADPADVDTAVRAAAAELTARR